MSSNAFILGEVHGFLPSMPKCPHRLLAPDSANTAELYMLDCVSCREGCISLSGIIHGKYPYKMLFETALRRSERIWDPHCWTGQAMRYPYWLRQRLPNGPGLNGHSQAKRSDFCSRRSLAELLGDF